MKHGSLFSGIGGFELAASWCGWENVFHCEQNPFGQKVLKHHFPNSKHYEDITTFDATNYAGRIDIISGGFPCQPFSTAGKRKGTDDERYLWKEMLRIIREVSPSYVVGENVRGLVNWNDGLVFETVCSDLEDEGYEVIPFILPAAAVNAPHRRDRVWFIAYSNNNGKSGRSSRNESKSRSERLQKRNEVQLAQESNIIRELSTNTENDGCRRGSSKRSEKRRDGLLSGEQERGTLGSETEGRCGERNATDTDDFLSEGGNGGRTNGWSEQTKRVESFNESKSWAEFPTQPPLCGGDDGIPRKLDSITFSKWRKESIKAYGNAIVPQVAYQIFKAIIETERRMEELL